MGHTPRARLLEMVAVIEEGDGYQIYVVFHARECTRAFLAQMGCSQVEINSLIGGSGHGQGRHARGRDS